MAEPKSQGFGLEHTNLGARCEKTPIFQREINYMEIVPGELNMDYIFEDVPDIDVSRIYPAIELF